jgi:hypothetical protein
VLGMSSVELIFDVLWMKFRSIKNMILTGQEAKSRNIEFGNIRCCKWQSLEVLLRGLGVFKERGEDWKRSNPP